VRVTEQYPKGLGKTAPELAARLDAPTEKNMFSCRQCEGLFDQLVAEQIRQVVLVGIEAHVCVQQTALDLISMGFDVFIVADAVGSRKPLDQEVAFQRMQSCGAMLTTSEAVMFEWCETSQDPQFKALSRLVLPTEPNLPN
jgi:nicotinamidase-related amidase